MTLYLLHTHYTVWVWNFIRQHTIKLAHFLFGKVSFVCAPLFIILLFYARYMVIWVISMFHCFVHTNQFYLFIVNGNITISSLFIIHCTIYLIITCDYSYITCYNIHIHIFFPELFIIYLHGCILQGAIIWINF